MRARFFYVTLFWLAIVSACARAAPLPITPLPNTSPVPTMPTAPKIPVVQLTVPAVVDTAPGTHASVSLQFEPMYLETGKTTSGATYTSLTRREDANLSQMRLCFEIEHECEPGGEWLDYKSEWKFQFDTDWMGERAVWVGAQFRDSAGNAIRAYNPSGPPDQNEFGAAKIVLNSSVDERTPMPAQPAFVQTAVASTRIAYPVTGSLVLQQGLCCAGGKVGTTIEIDAAFDASSPNTTVTQMRLMNHCGTQTEMKTAPWEPFVKHKIFPYTVTASNWVGWYLAVQYRDASGNLSPIYCEDISIEGMPQ